MSDLLVGPDPLDPLRAVRGRAGMRCTLSPEGEVKIVELVEAARDVAQVAHAGYSHLAHTLGQIEAARVLAAMLLRLTKAVDAIDGKEHG